MNFSVQTNANIFNRLTMVCPAQVTYLFISLVTLRLGS